MNLKINKVLLNMSKKKQPNLSKIMKVIKANKYRSKASSPLDQVTIENSITIDKDREDKKVVELVQSREIFIKTRKKMNKTSRPGLRLNFSIPTTPANLSKKHKVKKSILEEEDVANIINEFNGVNLSQYSSAFASFIRHKVTESTWVKNNKLALLKRKNPLNRPEINQWHSVRSKSVAETPKTFDNRERFLYSRRRYRSRDTSKAQQNA
mmetsp:Transcript_2062/g.1867  ORF Transcript_2062/g.1867 Transcript_2062/m.1867 type:complete len:210 (+) Transcript_2062:60-689(+)